MLLFSRRISKRMPRNTVGGKNFKKFKTGTEGYRARSAREAAEEMIDLIIRLERTPAARLTPEDVAASRLMFAGRVIRRFGHGRMEVFCHDGVTRQCRIRGLLRKKGQVYIDINSYVVVSLREAAESSDEETGIAAGEAAAGTADIVGLFDDKQRGQLQKTGVNPRLFVIVGADGKEEKVGDDLFERSEDEEEALEAAAAADEAEEGADADASKKGAATATTVTGLKLTKPKGRSQRGQVQASVKEVNAFEDEEINFRDL